MYSEATLFSALSGLAVFFSIFPLLWHINTRNIPAICLICWLMLLNGMCFINSLIWSGDILTAWDGKIYCDIQIKFIVAGAAGKLCALAALSRNLANIMRDDNVVVKTRAQRRKDFITDLVICFSIPIWMISVHYIVQPDRYWLVGVQGCSPSIDNSWPSIVLEFIWPPIAALLATYYAVLVLIRLRRYSSEFDQILISSSTTTKSRFYRLYAYSIILILSLAPTEFYILKVNLSVPRLPYSWCLVHGEQWKYIFKIPTYGSPKFDRWINVGAGFLLFLFFGLGRDAMGMYRQWAKTIRLEKYWDKMDQRRQRRRREKEGRKQRSNASDSTANESINGRGIVLDGHRGGNVDSMASRDTAGDSDTVSEKTIFTVLEHPSRAWDCSGQMRPTCSHYQSHKESLEINSEMAQYRLPRPPISPCFSDLALPELTDITLSSPSPSSVALPPKHILKPQGLDILRLKTEASRNVDEGESGGDDYESIDLAFHMATVLPSTSPTKSVFSFHTAGDSNRNRSDYSDSSSSYSCPSC